MNELYSIADLEQAVAVLRAGGVILYPTDTVWGIGCDATNEAAVARIYAIKQREDSKSMLVLVGSEEQLSRYATLARDARETLEIRWSGLPEKPTTIIYPNARGLAKNIVAADGSIGIRITSEAFSKELCLRLGKPVVSTSANISGHPTPHNYSQIKEMICRQVDYVCQYRRDETGEGRPSRILKINADNTVTVIRE